MRIVTILLILHLAIFPAWAAASDKSQSEPEEFFELDIQELMDLDVITATQIVEKASSSPSNIMVITRRQIRERGYRNLLELLEDLPNIDIQNKGWEGSFNLIGFRGLQRVNKFIIMQDSHRISSPTNEAIPIHDNYPLYHAKQVEIVFGPASTTYGADAFSGVINIITEDAEETDGVTLSTSYGQYNDYYNYLHFGKKLARNVDFSFGGHWNDSDNADLPSHYPTEFAKTDLTTFGGNTVRGAANREDYYFGTRSYSTFARLDIDDNFTIGFNQSFFSHPTSTGVRPEMTFFDKDVKFGSLIRNYYGEYRLGITDNFSTKSSLRFLTYELTPTSKYKNKYSDFNDAYKYSYSKKFMLEQQVTYRFLEKHIMVGGVSWEDFYSLPQTTDLEKPYSPNLPSTVQGLTYPGTNGALAANIYELNYNNVAGYVQFQSQWTDIVSSTLGLRYDYNTRYGKTLNPRAGMVLKPWSPTTLKLLYGESYLAPPPADAYRHLATFSGAQNANGDYIGTFGFAPNPDLKPEKSRTPEFQLIHNFPGNFSASLSGYYTFYNNLIFDVAHTDPGTFVKGGEFSYWLQKENLGEARMYGGDARIDYQGNTGRLRVNFWGNYSYTDGWEDSGNGTKVDLKYVAKHKIKSGFTFTWNNKYFATPMIRWIGETNKRTTDPNDPTKRLKTDDYILVNLHCGIDEFLIDGLSASLNIRNLFDNRYYNAGGGAADFPDSPQDPIRVRVTLTYKF